MLPGTIRVEGRVGGRVGSDIMRIVHTQHYFVCLFDGRAQFTNNKYLHNIFDEPSEFVYITIVSQLCLTIPT